MPQMQRRDDEHAQFDSDHLIDGDTAAITPSACHGCSFIMQQRYACACLPEKCVCIFTFLHRCFFFFCFCLIVSPPTFNSNITLSATFTAAIASASHALFRHLRFDAKCDPFSVAIGIAMIFLVFAIAVVVTTQYMYIYGMCVHLLEQRHWSALKFACHNRVARNADKLFAFILSPVNCPLLLFLHFLIIFVVNILIFRHSAEEMQYL